MPDTGKSGIKPVIVRLANRVELVVMTAGAAHRHPQERPARGIDDLVQRIGSNLGRLGGVLIIDGVMRASHQKGATDLNIGIARSDYISRQMLSEKDVKRLVLVYRTNHIVAKRPKIIDHPVLLEPNTLAKANHIQPMPTPTLAVVRRVQEAIDQLFVGQWIWIADEDIHLFHRWRKPNQVIGRSTDQCTTIRFRVKLQF